MEIKTEADSNDMFESPRYNDKPSVGMFGLSSICIPWIHLLLSRSTLGKDITFYCGPLFCTRHVISQLTEWTSGSATARLGLAGVLAGNCWAPADEVDQNWSSSKIKWQVSWSYIKTAVQTHIITCYDEVYIYMDSIEWCNCHFSHVTGSDHTSWSWSWVRFSIPLNAVQVQVISGMRRKMITPTEYTHLQVICLR